MMLECISRRRRIGLATAVALFSVAFGASADASEPHAAPVAVERGLDFKVMDAAQDQAAAAITVGEYTCKLTIIDSHHQPDADHTEGINPYDDAPRDFITLFPALTLAPGAATKMAKFPGGDHGFGPVIWYSETVETFRTDIKHDRTHPGLRVAGSSDDYVFHDDNSPTGDNLLPVAWAAPLDSQPIGAIDGVYIGIRAISVHRGTNTSAEINGYTKCGEMVHTGPMTWSLVDAPNTFVYSQATS